MKYLVYIIVLVCSACCSIKSNDSVADQIGVMPTNSTSIACENAQYTDYTTSPYVLPYPVGDSYRVDLNQCSSSYHAPGGPDQFAVDFAMPIGSTITASRGGTVVYVEESGADFGFPNNLVIVKVGDQYDQYMHLTQNGALVNEGSFVAKGQAIGESGATGLAGYPHLHFVVTQGGFTYPYSSIPHNFSNTDENVRGPESGVIYMAEPY